MPRLNIEKLFSNFNLLLLQCNDNSNNNNNKLTSNPTTSEAKPINWLPEVEIFRVHAFRIVFICYFHSVNEFLQGKFTRFTERYSHLNIFAQSPYFISTSVCMCVFLLDAMSNDVMGHIHSLRIKRTHSKRKLIELP